MMEAAAVSKTFHHRRRQELRMTFLFFRLMEMFVKKARKVIFVPTCALAIQ